MTNEDVAALNADFATFKAACEFWINKFNLGGWEIFIYQRNPEDMDALAATRIDNLDDRYATIEFFGKCKYAVNWEEVALHEVLHIVFALLLNDITDKVGAQHDIINKLVPMLKHTYTGAKVAEEVKKIGFKNDKTAKTLENQIVFTV